MGTVNGDPMEDEISTGDMATAFLQGYNFDPELDRQYIGYRSYPGAELDVWEYEGPIYGDEVAPMNLHDTFTDFMTGDMKYEKMTKEQVKKSKLGEVEMAYKQSKNELALYRHPETGHIVAKWVDDVITRGNRKLTDKFWNSMEKRWKLRSWGYVESGNVRMHEGCKPENVDSRRSMH